MTPPRTRCRRASFTRAEVRRVIQAARDEGLAVEGVEVVLPPRGQAGVEIRTLAQAAPPEAPPGAARRPSAPGAWD